VFDDNPVIVIGDVISTGDSGVYVAPLSNEYL
jgi:hypothetical protein